jgi:hypothetical protein
MESNRRGIFGERTSDQLAMIQPGPVWGPKMTPRPHMESLVLFPHSVGIMGPPNANTCYHGPTRKALEDFALTLNPGRKSLLSS